jgi:hypothetical protein
VDVSPPKLTRGLGAERAAAGSRCRHSILRDWIKGQVSTVECGILSFEPVFMPWLLSTDGRPLIERLPESNLLPSPEEPKVVSLPGPHRRTPRHFITLANRSRLPQAPDVAAQRRAQQWRGGGHRRARKDAESAELLPGEPIPRKLRPEEPRREQAIRPLQSHQLCRAQRLIPIKTGYRSALWPATK